MPKARISLLIRRDINARKLKPQNEIAISTRRRVFTDVKVAKQRLKLVFEPNVVIMVQRRNPQRLSKTTGPRKQQVPIAQTFHFDNKRRAVNVVVTSGHHAVKICFGVAYPCHIFSFFNELNGKYTLKALKLMF